MKPIAKLLAALCRPPRKRAILATSIAALLSSPSAFAAPITWGNTGTDFNAGASWVGGVAPGSGDQPTFTGPAVTNPNLSAGLSVQGLVYSSATSSGYILSSANGSVLTLTNPSGTSITASNTSGTNTISAALILAATSNTQPTISQAAGGTLNLTGGTSSNSGDDAIFSGGGTINLSGTNTFSTGSGEFINIGSTPGTTTTLGITGGTTTMNDGLVFWVGGDGSTTTASTANGIVTVSGGTLNINSNASQYGIAIGRPGNFGIMNVSGGTVNIDANSGLILGYGAYGSAFGTLNVNSGTITVNKGTAEKNQDPRYILLGTDGGNGTINLGNGAGSTGVLATGRIIAADGGSGTGGAITAAFVFNGGTLKALGANSDWLQAGTSSTSNTFAAALTSVTTTAVSTIDSNSFAVGINSAISGVGGFTIKDSSGTGTGVVTLGGANTYIGATTVSQGTLLVSNSISASATTVTGVGSKLGGTGTVGNVSVGSGAILEGGDGSAASGSLSSGGTVSLAVGSIIELTLGPGNTNSRLARTGGAWSFDLNQTFAFNLETGFAPGTYDDLITGLTGTELGLADIADWTISNPGVAGTFSYDNAGDVDLTITAATPEPATAALLLAGLPLLGLRRRRR